MGGDVDVSVVSFWFVGVAAAQAPQHNKLKTDINKKLSIIECNIIRCKNIFVLISRLVYLLPEPNNTFLRLSTEKK